MKLAKEKPEYYSVEKFGVPINDLDSMYAQTDISSASTDDPQWDNNYLLSNPHLARFPETGDMDETARNFGLSCPVASGCPLHWHSYRVLRNPGTGQIYDGVPSDIRDLSQRDVESAGQ
jgi:hypothetical protein